MELLSASLVKAVCHDSRVFRTWWSPLSITVAFSKSIRVPLIRAYSTGVVTKPHTTLQQHFSSPQFRPPSHRDGI